MPPCVSKNLSTAQDYESERTRYCLSNMRESEILQQRLDTVACMRAFCVQRRERNIQQLAQTTPDMAIKQAVRVPETISTAHETSFAVQQSGTSSVIGNSSHHAGSPKIGTVLTTFLIVMEVLNS